MNPENPYHEFENTELWLTIEKAISDLVKNQDIDLLTPEHYIIGYICKSLSNANEKKKDK